MRPSSFLFTCCQVGAEPALKKELARVHPDLHFAYSRPGFVTFKYSGKQAEALDAGFELRSVFARAYGISSGKSTGDPTAVLELARELAAEGGRAPHLHVWERDRHFPGDEPPGFVAGEWAREAQLVISGAISRGVFVDEALPADGEFVLDVVVVESGEWWLGYHRHSAMHAPWPGGRPPVTLPAEAPSRAYVKLEEAILLSRAPIRAGDIAVEIGSAPGGASYALLERGLKVVGIDPGAMDARVASHAGFKHITRPVAQVLREELPERVDWLLLDMNVEPRISLFAVDRLATRMSSSLLGVFLTVKLNQWSIADEIPSMLEHVRAMGLVKARATQLPSNRQEIMIHGLTRKGLARQGSAVKVRRSE